MAMSNNKNRRGQQEMTGALEVSTIAILECALNHDENATPEAIKLILSFLESPEKYELRKICDVNKFEDKNILTRKEAANYLNLSVSGFDKIKKRESIPCHYYGPRALRFKKSDLDDFQSTIRIS